MNLTKSLSDKLKYFMKYNKIINSFHFLCFSPLQIVFGLLSYGQHDESAGFDDESLKNLDS